MQSRTKAWGGALAVTLVALVLAGLDLDDRSVRRWWGRHAFTTSIVSGMLVLLVTVLIVNRVLSVRQVRDRSRAIAAQAAIVMSQAARATRAVVAVLKGGDRDTASDELRTYMTMLLISAPVLIDASVSRTFLEEAQTLGAELARALAATRNSEPTDELRAHLDEAVDRMRAVSQPLLNILRPEERLVVTAEDTGTNAQDMGTGAEDMGTGAEDTATGAEDTATDAQATGTDP